MGIFYRLREKLDWIILNLAVLCFGAGVIATFLGVVFRSIPSLPGITWTGEFTAYMMITATFLVTGIGIRRGIQLSVSLIPEKLPEPLFRILTIVNGLLMLVFLSIVGYYGFQSALMNQGQMSQTLGISMFYPYLVVPIGACLMIMESVARVIEAALGRAPRPNELNPQTPANGQADREKLQ